MKDGDSETERKRKRGGINYSTGMQMSIFYLGVAKEGRRALSFLQEQPPCGLWISCSESKKEEKRTLSLCLFYSGRNKTRNITNTKPTTLKGCCSHKIKGMFYVLLRCHHGLSFPAPSPTEQTATVAEIRARSPAKRSPAVTAATSPIWERESELKGIR